MKTQLVLFAFLLLTPFVLWAQKTSYAGAAQVDFLAGGSGPSYSFNITQGIRINQWLMGVGAGMDYYRFRSMPVFLDVKKCFTLKKMAPFIQVAGGINFAKPKESEKIIHYTWSAWFPKADTASTKGGMYARVNAGLIINRSAKWQWGVVAGWSYKIITTTYEDQVYNGTVYVSAPVETRYSLNRTSIGLVFIF